MRNIIKYFDSGKVARLLFVMVAAVALYSCKAVKPEEPVYTKKPKTVLIYMIANNSLSSDAVSSYANIMQGYIPGDDGNLLLYFHNSTSDPVMYNIHKNGSGVAVADIAYSFPSRNSATSVSLKQALSVAATLFPADEYGLILWSHGTGWLPSGYYATGVISSSASSSGIQQSDAGSDLVKMARNSSGGISQRTFGSESNKEIEITDLATAFPYRLSFILFDACLMGGIEVAYEIKDMTDYIIFSPTEVLTESFPYKTMMQYIFKSPSDLKSVCEDYYNFYNSKTGETRAATISLIDCSQLSNLADVAKEIFSSGRGKISTLDMSTIQPYFRSNKHWFYDIKDLMDNIATSDQAIKFNDALSKVVLYKATTPYFLELKIDRFSGISTYIPNPANTELDNFYKNFKWNKDAGMIE